MLEPGVGEELRVALVNAGLLALWAVLPGLVFGYTRQWLAARRIRPQFSLRRSEAIELDRALLLYEKVCYRLKKINDQDEGANSCWRGLFGRRIEPPQHAIDELEDLEAHAHHLQWTIIRLKRRPLQRLRSWLHILSWRFTLGGALAAHVVCLALLMVAVHTSWADELTAGVTNPLVWYPFDERLFYANAVAAVYAAIAAPVLFLVRRVSLRREYSLELCALKEFAAADPRQVIDQLKADGADQDPSQPVVSSDGGQDNSWFAVLGLSHSATIEEVKEAYKTLIKQNHPDRVHGMSRAFRQLAEAETKKLNAAYQHALFSLPAFVSRQNTAPN